MEKYLILQEEIYNGIRKLYRFDNNRGASVICHDFSYGGKEGLWEVLSVVFEGNDYELGNKHKGWLTWDEVMEMLQDIKKAY